MARRPGPPKVRVHIALEQRHYEWLLLRYGKNGEIQRGKMSDLINMLMDRHVEEEKEKENLYNPRA